MPTNYRGAPREVRALDAYIKLTRAANSLALRTQRFLGAHGLTAGQFGVLEVLLHLGPVIQRQLGEKLLSSGGNITMVVDNLERRQLVRRSRDSEDRRLITIHLTSEGRRLIERIFPEHVDSIVEAFSVLGSEEQEQLGELCKRLGLHSSAAR